MTCPARNPDPPVTSTMSVMVRLNLFLQQFGPEFDRGRGDAFLGGRVADDSGGPEVGLGRHVALPQLQPGDLAAEPLRVPGEQRVLVGGARLSAVHVRDVCAHVMYGHTGSAQTAQALDGRDEPGRISPMAAGL